MQIAFIQNYVNESTIGIMEFFIPNNLPFGPFSPSQKHLGYGRLCKKRFLIKRHFLAFLPIPINRLVLCKSTYQIYKFYQTI